MAFNPQYVNLNGYEAAQLQRMANQQSPLDAALQGLNQGVQLGQLPQTLQDQQLARQLNNALLSQKLTDLQNPNAALARKLTEELTLRGALNPDLGIVSAPAGTLGQTIFSPGAITAEQQASLPSQDLLNLRQNALDQAGVTSPALVIPTAPAAGLPETPISAFGIQTGLNSNPNIPKAASQEKFDLQTQLAMLNHPDRTAATTTSEVPIGMSADQKFIITQNKNTGAISRQAIPGVENTPSGQPTILPLPGKGSQERKIAITGNEIAKAISEAGLLGISYDPSTHGDLTVPANYAEFKKEINDANSVQGTVSDPKLKQLAIRVQQNFNKEPVVTTKKNLEIFGKEASDAIQHIIDHPDEPAGARQIEAFDSFIKAFSAGKPTVAQYGSINQYQSVENQILSLPARLTSGQRLTNEELLTYADAIKTASQSIDQAYQDKVNQYRDEAIGYGINKAAVSKIIKSEGGAANSSSSNNSSERISGNSGTAKSGIKFQLIK